MLQEGILCEVFSQKCSAAWQGARGERLTVEVMLPGRQDRKTNRQKTYVPQKPIFQKTSIVGTPEHSHRRTHCTGIQQREAPAAGRTPMDEHQFEVEGAERPYVRPRSYWKAQRISQHLVI